VEVSDTFDGLRRGEPPSALDPSPCRQSKGDSTEGCASAPTLFADVSKTFDAATRGGVKHFRTDFIW